MKIYPEYKIFQLRVFEIALKSRNVGKVKNIENFFDRTKIYWFVKFSIVAMVQAKGKISTF